MATVEYRAALPTSAGQAWKVLRQFGAIADWHPAIIASKIEDGQPDSTIGAVRRLDLADGGVIRERLVSLDDALMTLAYLFEESPLPIDHYRASVKVIEVSGHPQCTVEWHARFEVRDAQMTAHFEALITRLFVEGHDSLARYLAR